MDPKWKSISYHGNIPAGYVNLPEGMHPRNLTNWYKKWPYFKPFRHHFQPVSFWVSMLENQRVDLFLELTCLDIIMTPQVIWTLESPLGRRSFFWKALLLMEEIRRLHQLRLVVYHILYKVYISQVVQDFLHQQYQCQCLWNKETK